jgi:hypothetical protein
MLSQRGGNSKNSYVKHPSPTIQAKKSRKIQALPLPITELVPKTINDVMPQLIKGCTVSRQSRFLGKFTGWSRNPLYSNESGNSSYFTLMRGNNQEKSINCQSPYSPIDRLSAKGIPTPSN